MQAQISIRAAWAGGGTKHAWEYQACRWGPVHRIESTNQHLKGMELSIARPRGDRFRAEKWEEEMAQK